MNDAPREVRFSGDIMALGYIPQMLSSYSDKPMIQQLHEGYAHGGGWQPFKGFTVVKDPKGRYSIKYPGDPAYHEVARIDLGAETLVMFPHSWVLVIDAAGVQHIARMD